MSWSSASSSQDLSPHVLQTGYKAPLGFYTGDQPAPTLPQPHEVMQESTQPCCDRQWDEQRIRNLQLQDGSAAGSRSSVPHLLMVWVMEVCRCSPALLAGSWGRDGTRLLSAGMLTLRRNAWRRVGCKGNRRVRAQPVRMSAIQHQLLPHILLAAVYSDHTLLDHSTRSREAQSVGFAS